MLNFSGVIYLESSFFRRCNIRDDEPHGGADYPHSHWYDGDNKNEDFVVVKK